MADNTTLPGTGEVIANKDIGGVKFQKNILADPTGTNLAIVDANGNLAVASNDVGSSSSLAAVNAQIQLSLNGHSTAAVQITGTWSATCSLEISIDGTNWGIANGLNTSTNQSYVAGGAFSNGVYQINVAGLKYVRVRMSARTSGTAVVSMNASYATSVATSGQVVGATLTSSVNTIGNVGGTASHAATANGNPNRIAGKSATTVNPTATTPGQVTDLMVDKLGKVVAVPAIRELTTRQRTQITTTNMTVIATGITGQYVDIYSILMTNSSSTATVVTISDGNTPFTIALPANSTWGANFNSPWKASLTGSAWVATSSVAVTTLDIVVQSVASL